MKMTELTRMLKCLTAKSYHSLQDDYSRASLIPLIPQGDSSAESVLGSSSSNLESENFSSVGSSDKLRVRPRSVGDISESIRGGRDVVIVQESVVAPTESHHLQNVQQNNLQSSNHHNNSHSNSTTVSGGGGILSFFGVRFHKSGTRHLDRSSGDRTLTSDLPDKPRKTVGDRDRYTKFPLTPLTSPSQLLPQSGNVNSNVPLHTDSPFDATHIQLTPQTKTYAHPHKSPVPPVKGIIGTNSNKFLANAVSSLGRKTKDCCTISDGTTRTHQKRNKQLKVKSKSDNSLHKVTLNNVNTGSANSTSTTTTTVRSVLSPDFYPQGEQRLNSVQLGDHATIRLPWTGFQPQNLNNLSSVTPRRTHPNTHNNHLLDLDSVRYVECGVWTHSQPTRSSSDVHNHPSSRRRSRSLERSSNFRIFPITHSIPQNNRSDIVTAITVTNSHLSGTTTTTCTTTPTKSFTRQSNSLERPRHRVRQSLSPSEQEILSRNLCSYNNNRRVLTDVPPPLPKKSKPPPLGQLQSRSAPNSSFSSVESSSSDSASAPPSPPPRPLSTLRPESRLISSTNSTQQGNNNKKPQVNRTRESQNSNSKLNNNNTTTINPTNSATTMNNSNSNVDRRPLPRNQDHHTSPVSPDTTTHESGVGASAVVNSASTTNLASAMSLEEAISRNSGFINKPSKGWLHSDQLLSKDGVTYTVRYIGCLDVNTSMKSLDFDTRSLIAKECINLVCEAAGLKSVDKKRKTDRRVARILGLRPRLDQAGSDVHLTITSTCLKLTSLDTGNVIATHDLPNISFASGGDATMLDFVAYVAKDSVIGRACFILECGGRAQDVITTVGQAFELRFKEYLQKRPPPRGQNEDPEREYYNDMPGKVPPEISSTTFVRGGQGTQPTLSSMKEIGKQKVGGGGGRASKGTPTLVLPTSSPSDNKDVISVNLIDFEAPTPPAFGPSAQDKNLEALLLSGGGTISQGDGHGNGLGGSGLISPGISQGNKDPFNMQPFVHSISNSSTPLTPADQRAQLEAETWFHGVISRGEAEALVQNDGDFLVRESQTTPGQYVLTGLQSGTAKHLLLVDPEGVVRTKDREFDSVIHLIRYHSDNSLPIISAESMVLLRHPINKKPSN